MTALLLFTLSLNGNILDPVDILIKGGIVVTVDENARVLTGGAVGIVDDRITIVLKSSDSLPKAKKTVYAKGHLIIPGLVNTHGHAAMTLLRGLADDLTLTDWLEKYIFPIEARHVSQKFVYTGTLLGCIEMVKTGTTTYADMYYFENEVARATETVGIRGVLGQTIIGFAAPDYETPEQALLGAEIFIEKYKNHPLIIPSIAPHALYTTPLGIIAKAHSIATKHHVPFQIHAVEPPEENNQMLKTFGKRTTTLLDEIGALKSKSILHHGIWLSDEDISRIKGTGVGISHNPESNMKTASGLAPVPKLLSAQIPVGLGTDGAASNNNLDMFEEMDTAAKIHKFATKDPTTMPAKTIFRMATMGGAEALGLDGSIGSIEVGKKADIVLINTQTAGLPPMYDVYSHLVYAIKGSHVSTVLVDGKFIVVDKKLITINEIETIAMANAIKEKILLSLK